MVGTGLPASGSSGVPSPWGSGSPVTVTVPYSTVPPLSSSSPLLVTVIATMPATTTTTATTAMIRMVRARELTGPPRG